MPRKAATAKPAGAGGKKGAKGAYKLADPLPSGEILNDLSKGSWVTGKAVGCGGFGLIYLATPQGNGPADAKSKFVVKVEPKSNGPLFSELSFYQRSAKESLINQFKSSKKLKSMGMPRFVASGQHVRSGESYRFMVMDRFNTDLQKLFETNGKQFPEKTVFTLAIQVLYVLEFIHSQGYVHADIKASNMLLGFDKSQENQAYLVDYGLAAKFLMDGKHKEYKEDPRRCHDGTIEFTSVDAHKGVAPSRRGDLEILGYCVLQWLSGKLPWEDKLNDKEYVKAQKIKYMGDIPGLMKKCSIASSQSDVQKYLQYVKSMDYNTEPNYDMCRKYFKDAIKKSGEKDDGKLVFTSSSKKITKSKSKKRKSDSTTEEEVLSSQGETDMEIVSPKRTQKVAPPAKSRAKNPSTAVTATTSSPAVSRLKSPTKRVRSPAVRASPRARIQSPGARKAAANNAAALGVAASAEAKPKRKKNLLPVDVAVQTSPGLKGLKRSRQKKD